jgi:hypothetical protein
MGLDPREARDSALRHARYWLVGVGVLLWVLKMVMLNLALVGVVTTAERAIGTTIATLALGLFLVLAYYTPRKPRLCLSLGLALFWTIQLLDALVDPANLTRMPLLKIFFTVALIRGLKSASDAVKIDQRLGQIFE